MKNRHSKFTIALILIALLGWISADGKKQTVNGKVLYRVGLVGDKAKMIAVKQKGKNLELHLEGFGRIIALKANGGGVETCRTTLEHKSGETTVILSLPIPTPNTPCQMTAGYVTINAQTYKISMSEAEVKKTLGNDAQLRKLTEKYFGETKGE